MGEYFKVRAVEGFRKSAREPTPFEKNVKSYFKWLKLVGTGRENSSISHLSLSQSDNLCSVSFGSKVLIYDYESQSVIYNHNSCKSFSRCAAFRSDSKLLAVSDDQGTIDIVALPLKSLLRRFNKAHDSACFCVKFSNDKLNLLSGGDDCKVKLWDIAAEKCVLTLNGHSDRVRTLCSLPGDDNLWVTGSYDKFARVFDIRTPEQPISKLAHESPVEHVQISSSGFKLITSSSNCVKVWDLSSGLKLEHSLHPHLRTILSSYLCDERDWMVTSSLDGSVKFTQISGNLPLHAYSYESQITAFDYSYSDSLAIGFSSGEWLIRYNSSHKLNTSNLLDNGNPVKHDAKDNLALDNVKKSIEVVGYKPPKLGLLDRLLKTFQYKAAMDLALTLTGTLSTAVKNRDEKTIIPLLRFVSAHINKDVNNTSLILEFLISILDNNPWLKSCSDETVLAELKRIPSKINLELYQHTILLRLQGLIDLIL